MVPTDLEVVISETGPNKGNVCEGILAVVLTCRFSNPDSPLPYEEIWNTINQLDCQENQSDQKFISKTLETKNVKLGIELAENNWRGLVSPKFFRSIHELVGSAISFASTPVLMNLAKELAGQNVRVVSTGMNEGKTDIEVFSNNCPVLRLSLKGGRTKQLGQVGRFWGSSEERTSRGIYDLFDSFFGVQISSTHAEAYDLARREGNYKEIKRISNLVYEELFEITSGKINSRRFAEAIKQEAVTSDDDVKLLHLKRRGFEVLDFNKLVKLASEENHFTLDYKPATPTEKAMPYLVVRDSQDAIVSIRPKIRIKKDSSGLKEFRHYIQQEKSLSGKITLNLWDSKEAATLLSSSWRQLADPPFLAGQTT